MIPAERRASWRMHKVSSGETMAAIGKRYGMSAAASPRQWNVAGCTRVGDRLLIPASYRAARQSRRNG